MTLPLRTLKWVLDPPPTLGATLRILSPVGEIRARVAYAQSKNIWLAYTQIGDEPRELVSTINVRPWLIPMIEHTTLALLERMQDRVSAFQEIVDALEARSRGYV